MAPDDNSGPENGNDMGKAILNPGPHTCPHNFYLDYFSRTSLRPSVVETYWFI